MIATKLIATRARMVGAAGGFYPKLDDVVPSPCVSVCRMAPDNSVCEGCLRSLDEIRVWSGATSAERRAIWLRFATAIILALEFTLAADIIRSAIAPSWDAIGKLGAIAAIRIALNFFLARDIETLAERNKRGEGEPAGE